MLFIDPGPFTNTPTSYDYTIYVDGVSYFVGPVFTSLGGPSFQVPDELIGNQLSVKCHGINGSGTSATTSNSSSTSAVADIDLSGAAPVLTRTSSSAATPFTVSMAAFTSAVWDGYVVQRIIATANAVDGTTGELLRANQVYSEGVYLDATTLAAPNTIAWPTFNDSSYTQLYEQRRIVAPRPAGTDTVSPWSNMVKKSDAPTNTTAYTKYRLNVTNTGSGFYTLLGEFKIAATEAGADTVNNSGVTISASNAAGGAAANARDGNAATYWATDLGSGVAYPHILTVDYTGGTAIAANEFKLQCATGGGATGAPKDFTIDGWNGSSWINLVTKTGITWTDGEVKTYVL